MDDLDVIGPVVSAVLALGTIAYNRWESLFLFTNRLRFRLTRPTALWTVQVRSGGEHPRSVLEYAERALRQQWPDARILNRDPDGVTLLVDGVPVIARLEDRVEIGGEAHYQRFVIEFPDVRATYNESERIIESIASIVRSVDRVCTLPNVEYGAKVKFPKNNPYFGLYTKRIRAGEVVAFEAIFKPTLDRTGSAAANTVTVGRDAVSVACRDIGSWVLLSKKYLAAR